MEKKLEDIVNIEKLKELKDLYDFFEEIFKELNNLLYEEIKVIYKEEDIDLVKSILPHISGNCVEKAFIWDYIRQLKNKGE